MVDRAVVSVCVLMMATACGGSPDFSPPPETYTASRAAVEGVEAQLTIARVDSTFFGIVMPMLGRRFLPREHEEGSAVVILSNPFWLDHLGGRPDVIGSELEVGGRVRRIVGIMPAGVDAPAGVALWIPGN